MTTTVDCMQHAKSLSVVVGFKNIKLLPKPTFKQKLISRFTKSDYIHVEIAIDDTWIASEEGKGVHIKPYDENYKAEGWEYYKLPDIFLEDARYEELKKWIKSIDGAKYDWINIFLYHAIRLGIDHNSKWTCSELVGKLLQALNIPGTIAIRPERLNPGDVYKLIDGLKA